MPYAFLFFTLAFFAFRFATENITIRRGSVNLKLKTFQNMIFRTACLWNGEIYNPLVTAARGPGTVEPADACDLTEL